MEIKKKSTLFKALIRDKDTRGSIISIVDDSIQNVSIIECNKGMIRSNHYHKEDFHYMFVLEGEIDYFFKDLNKEDINYFKVKKDDIIFTPNKEIHATYFPVKTKLIVSSKMPRDQETYENDTIRVDFINEKNIKFMLEKYGKIK